jgi:HAD superfamily hydrolase (TIGR01509 family)
MNRLRALIFDVDGTLAETEEAHRRAFNETFAEMGLHERFPDAAAGWVWDQALYERLLKTTGGKERIAAYLKGDLGVDPAPHGDLIAQIHAAKTRRYAALMAPGQIALRAGIVEIIARAREAGLKLGVATTTSAANIDALILATLGEPAAAVFDAIAAGDEVAAKKPAPDVYRLALARLGLPAEACLALEDSRNGLMSAKAAGIRCLICPGVYTRAETFPEADRVTTAFSWDDIVALDGADAGAGAD